MDLFQLETFLMVASEGSFSRAAKKLYRTQPAISQTVRKLEARIILNALHANNWNRKKAARSLDISYRALLYKLKEVGIPQRRSSSTTKHDQDKAE